VHQAPGGLGFLTPPSYPSYREWEALLVTPNPTSRSGTDSCTAAAEYYNKGPSSLPPSIRVPPPRVVRVY
jgi:hypothetical protein